MALPAEVLPSICAFLEAPPAAAAAATSRAWRQAALGDSEAWRQRFVDFWRVRQKPSLLRAWWLELLACGAVEPAALTLTAPLQAEVPQPESPSSSEQGERQRTPSRPQSERERKRRERMRRWLRRSNDAAGVPAEATQEVANAASSLWHSRFVLAARDLQRSALTKAELCFDVAMDRHETSSDSEDVRQEGRGERRRQRVAYGRRWVLAEGAYREDFLGDELKFNPDGTVDPRSCLFALVPDPMVTWRWRLAGGGHWVVLSTNLDGQRGEDGLVVVLTVERARDGGFLLRSPQGLLFCSREKTEEEHLYRSYNVLRFPASLQVVMEDLAIGHRPTPYAFPTTLTNFERLVVHRLAESLGLRHDSRGYGVQRRIVVWRIEDAVPPEHDCPVDGGAGGRGAAAAHEVAAAALGFRQGVAAEDAAAAA